MVFAGGEGGGHGESAGAQCEEDEWLEMHFEVLVEMGVEGCDDVIEIRGGSWWEISMVFFIDNIEAGTAPPLHREQY